MGNFVPTLVLFDRTSRRRISVEPVGKFEIAGDGDGVDARASSGARGLPTRRA
jgi:hypothetical protein